MHNTVNSLNRDEGHNIDELSEGGPSFEIPDWWFVFQRVTFNGKGSGIYHYQKVCGSFQIGDYIQQKDIYEWAYNTFLLHLIDVTNWKRIPPKKIPSAIDWEFVYSLITWVF